MNALVEKLSNGKHSVMVSLRPEKTMAEFKACLDRKYVLIKFTETKGGTELGFRLSEQDCVIPEEQFSLAAGKVHLEGDLVLDYVPVRCVADIDLSTLDGLGYLKIRE